MDNLENLNNAIENNTGNDQGSENNTHDNGEQENKTFSQADVDRIVQERLAREKGKFSDYDDLKEVNEILDDFGYSGMSLAEKKKLLRENADSYKSQTEQREVEDYSKNTDLYNDVKQLNDKIKKFEEKEAETAKQKQQKENAQKEMARQIKEFSDKYSDVSVEKLANQPKFKRFFKNTNPALSLTQIYEEYIEFVGNKEVESIRINLNDQRSTNSGKNSGGVSGGYYGLTEQQRAIADEAGMSYEVYSKHMKNIE